MKKFFTLAIAICLTAVAFAQNPNRPMSISQRAQAALSAGGEQLDAIKAELAGMLKGNDEMTYLQAQSAYSVLGDRAKVKEITEMVKKKFPKGRLVRSMESEALYNIKPASEQEKAYQKFLKKFPKAKNEQDDVVYEYPAYSLATEFAREGNVAKAKEYLDKINHRTLRVNSYSGVASALSSSNPEEALNIYAQGSEYCDELKNQIDRRQMSELEMLWLGYGNLLYKQGQSDEALKQFEKVSAQRRGFPYAQILCEKGHPMQLFTLSESLLRTGRGNADTEKYLKTAWEKANGNLDGCEEFINQIKAQRAREQREEIMKSQISEKAPDFTITDGDGKKVSLSDFKGKTVILDFWATWCGPCKASFPAMKRAVEQYKEDDSVVFLFIHTWERGSAEDAIKGAKQYLAENGYDNFNLLMDVKDPNTNQNPAVTAYGVSGIPAKFVIDPEGNIRYKLTGFKGNDDEAVAEISIMVESLRPNVRRPRR